MKMFLSIILFLLGCLALYAIAYFTGFDLNSFSSLILSIPLSLFVFWLVLAILEYLLQVMRFKEIIIEKDNPHSFLDFSIFYNIGHLIAFLSPSRSIGEAARVFVFKKYLGVSKTKALSSIVIERAFDILVLAFASVGILSLVSSALLPIGLILVAVGFVIFLTNDQIHSIIVSLIPVAFIRDFAEKYFLYSRTLVGDKTKFARISLYSVALWLFDFLRYWLILSYFGVKIPFELSVSITSLSYFSTILSVFPGGLAFFEGMGTGLLSILGYDSSQILGALLVERIFSYWMWIFTGVIVFFLKGVKIES